MCTIICTVRTVLWYAMSIAGTLMILVSVFANTWLEGQVSGTNFQVSGTNLMTSAENIADTVADTVDKVMEGDVQDAFTRHVGLFMKYCTTPVRQKLFDGECIPDLKEVQTLFTDLDDSKYPHAWRGAVVCFVFGLILMIITDVFAVLTFCCRGCICCSVFTICGSVQSFAGMLFTLGLIAYPAGWGSQVVKDTYCAGSSAPFILGDTCSLGEAFWLAVAGTICTVLASSLAIWAYQSTKSAKCEERMDQGEHCICLA